MPDRVVTLPAPGSAVHIIAIGGVMMSAIARLLTARGYRVSGSDLHASEYTDALRDEGLTVHIGHAPSQVPADCALVAISAAIPDHNPELVEARRRGLTVLTRADVLGAVVNTRQGVAVAGTHGKTTTSGMAAVLFAEGGLQPTFLVGSTVTNYHTNCRPGDGPWVVLEADEYARAFLALEPEIAVVTNLEPDHPDIYADFDDLRATFRQFVSQVRPTGLLLLGADCGEATALASACRGEVQTYGFADHADWQVQELAADGPVRFTLRAPDGTSHPVATRLFGRHNAQNATAAIACAVRAGVPFADACRLMERFEGTGRRFEQLTAGSIRVIDDYAHHPTEVRATIAAAKQLGGRLRVVYEPHQYARTRDLLLEYAGVFDDADETLVCDIHAAREADCSGVSAADVARVGGGEANGVVAVGPADAAFARLTGTAGEHETWLVMGAGNITHTAHRLAAWVESRRT